ncbi:hypothetical protein EV210_101211 [Anaerospora hongkongensis]|uniref:Uncharacterized protein n=1 Tax=Anaerospora hongkongensis TaxID=244830 RepID=A0A4R1QC28_9FIRM|nr:hypothetical protein EV210_101211 [Anaerospora hongkongensis]
MKRSEIKVGGIYRGCNRKLVIVTDIYCPGPGDRRKDDIVVYQVIQMHHNRGSRQRVGQEYEAQMLSFASWAMRKVEFELGKLQIWDGYM